MRIKRIALFLLRLIHEVCSFMPSIGIFQPMGRSFSAEKLLKSHLIVGDIIHEHQRKGPCPPNSMTLLAGFQQHDHQPWPIFWTLTTNARLVGKLFYWRNIHNHPCSEGLFNGLQRRTLGEDSLTAQIIVPKATQLKGAWTVIHSNWNKGDNYYHWLLDGLTRLAVRSALPEETNILVPDNMSQFAKETLILLGLHHRCYQVSNRCVQPQRYYFCSPTAMTGVSNPFGYRWLRKEFSPYFSKPNSAPPIFFTRRSGSRVPSDLVDIESVLVSFGFNIIDCATISVKRQIEYASSAIAIAGLHGAAMTNLLWATVGISVVELFDPNYLNGCYEQIALQGGLNYSYLIMSDSSFIKNLNSWCASVKTANRLTEELINVAY
jgi:hypothetical protein